MRGLSPFLLLALLGCNFPKVMLVPSEASGPPGEGQAVFCRTQVGLKVCVRYLSWTYAGLAFQMEVSNGGTSSVLVAPEAMSCNVLSAGRVFRTVKLLDPRSPMGMFSEAGSLKKHTLDPGETIQGTATFDLTRLEDARYRDLQVVLPLGSETFTFAFKPSAPRP